VIDELVSGSGVRRRVFVVDATQFDVTFDEATERGGFVTLWRNGVYVFALEIRDIKEVRDDV
jgi:hypothetical protein